MTGSSEDPRLLVADFLTWLKQNNTSGNEWYLDEGPVEVPEAATSVVEESAAVPEPAPEAAVDSTPKPTPKPVQAAEPTDAFEQRCIKFVAATLNQIQIQASLATSPAAGESSQTIPEHNKSEMLAAIETEVRNCLLCDLHAKRTKTVFGSGDSNADIVFIGEAPGHDEDLQGEPFVGPSGQLLTKILGAIGFERSSVFICNILKCRPPKNRDPLPAEVTLCEAYLKRQLEIIQPRVICCLGKVAANTLLGTDVTLRALRDTVHFYQGIPVMATYHPAALLRNPQWKKDTWDDVRLLKALHDALGKQV